MPTVFSDISLILINTILFQNVHKNARNSENINCVCLGKGESYLFLISVTYFRKLVFKNIFLFILSINAKYTFINTLALANSINDYMNIRERSLNYFLNPRAPTSTTKQIKIIFCIRSTSRGIHFKVSSTLSAMQNRTKLLSLRQSESVNNDIDHFPPHSMPAYSFPDPCSIRLYLV